MSIVITAPVTVPTPIEVTAPITGPASIEVTAPITFGFQGPQGEPGTDGTDGADYSPSTDWMGLARGARTISSPLSTSLAGEVYQYDYDGAATRYRYISNDGTIDAFYDSYTAPATLGTLIVSKFITIL